MQQQKRLNEAIVAYESAISYRPRLAREYLPTYLPTLPTYYQCHFQCDYIVLFIKGLDNKFSYERRPNNRQHFGLFWKNVASLGQNLENIGLLWFPKSGSLGIYDLVLAFTSK